MSNYYILFNSESQRFNAIENNAEGHSHNNLRGFVNNGVEVFIVGNIGPYAFEIINSRIAVFSGKGGVGKTTVSVNLAYALKNEGFTTGILDSDITGPNVAKMFGIDSEAIILNSKIIPFEKHGVKMISIASLIGRGQPVIWRGPLRSKMINQFLADVEWEDLDYLIADLPPGTGDEILTICQQMKPDYAVIVTTPQEVSIIDAERAVNMAKQLHIPFIGIIENMSGFICPHCNKEIELFGRGGGKKLAENYGVNFLGSIPVDIEARVLSDEGKPVVLEKKNSEIANAFKNISNTMLELSQKAHLEILNN